MAPPKYNETEYRTVAEIATLADGGLCDRETIDKLSQLAVFLDHYTKYIPNNTLTWESAVVIRGQVKDLANRVPVSETFCKLKMGIIGQTAEAMQKGSGGK